MKNLTLSSAQQPFVRNRFTWLSYLLMAAYCYLQVSPGSIVPFLHAEMHLNYTIDSLHVSSLAVGLILSGLFGDRITRILGRQSMLWLCVAGLCVGGLLLMLAYHPLVSISGILCIGFCGCTVSNIVQSALSDYYGSQRTIAITEANTIACLGSVTGPLILGMFLSTWLGWRGMFLVPLLMMALLAAFFYNVRLPARKQPEQSILAKRARVSRACWLYLGVMVLVVAFEWGTFTWGSGYLINIVGIETRTASTLMSLFFFAEMFGRFMGSLLTRRFSAEQLLVVALGIAGVGFLLFWLGPTPWIHILGLFVAGLGIGNLFPLTFTIVLNQEADNTDAAAARSSLAAGLAILIAPLLLGRAADTFGLRISYSFVLVLFIMACIVLVFARYASHKEVTPLELEIEQFLQEQARPVEEVVPSFELTSVV
ncbi:MFS transporter [Dictyobacter vulcani]|uniref:MFS transporter n=1 Tax=Dictyobacter vulcani TaxID=2607529 RepID=A0A5J4KXR6_9CHLR|nr:MFS transporter [Dictyobacter vulcani]GER90919.1 MFS transporter [Dictyobacter vulcani]